MNDNKKNLGTELIKSTAALTSTPFRTAFKLTLGVLAAQLFATLVALVLFIGFVLIIYVLHMLLN